MNKDFEKQHPRNAAGRFERKSRPDAARQSSPVSRGKQRGGRGGGLHAMRDA